MMKRVFRVENIVFFLLCIVSAFSYSRCMTDTHIMPKWYFTVFVLLIGVLVLLSKGIFNKLSKIDTFIFGCFISVIAVAQTDIFSGTLSSCW